MSPLQSTLATYRDTSQSEREKGSYFEELIRTYFRYEATYADLYSQVWLYSDWAREIGTPQFGMSGKDTGIDLVAKLIMACGTGKTFTSLKIAEEVAGEDKRVLFLVPSLNLLSQTLIEWTQESAIPFRRGPASRRIRQGRPFRTASALK